MALLCSFANLSGGAAFAAALLQGTFATLGGHMLTSPAEGRGLIVLLPGAVASTVFIVQEAGGSVQSMRLACGHDMLDPKRLLMAFAHPCIIYGPQETCSRYSHMKLHCLCALQLECIQECQWVGLGGQQQMARPYLAGQANRQAPHAVSPI